MQGDASAAVMAEELVADEDKEAAKAAAKKAKKQRAKAKKQQAHSEATAAAESAGSIDAQTSHSGAVTSTESTQQGTELAREVSRLSISPDRHAESSSTEGAAGPDSDSLHASAAHGRDSDPVPAAQDSDDAALDARTASARAVDASRHGDAEFLDQLFCCPITKVRLPCSAAHHASLSIALNLTKL